MMNLVMNLLIFLFLFSWRIMGAFNYDVGARVVDKVSDFTARIYSASYLSYFVLTSGAINSTSLYRQTQLALYPTAVVYKSQITDIYAGFEDGRFILSTDKASDFAIPRPGQSEIPIVQYETKPGGYLGAFVFNDTYDCRKRPWYIQAKAAGYSLWSTPYPNSGNFIPVITLVLPIYDGNRHFTGVLGADVFLTQISSFLNASFHGQDRRVFIVDKLTMNLLGDSGNAQTAVLVNGSPVWTFLYTSRLFYPIIHFFFRHLW